MRRLITLTLLSLTLSIGSLLASTPTVMNYQGFLTDGSGNPVADGNYSVTFKIYNAAGGGIVYWMEIQSVTTVDGLFSVLLGSTTPISHAVFVGAPRYLGIKVGTDPELSPRTMLVTVPHAFRVATVDSAAGGTIASKVTIGTTNANSGIDAFVFGNDNIVDGDYSVVGGRSNYAGGDKSGVLSGEFHELYSSNSVIAGGSGNYVDGPGATIGGGFSNVAEGAYSFIGGGDLNVAINNSVVSGGLSDSASGDYSAVLGGGFNTASGDYSAVVGGGANKARGNYSIVGGGGGFSGDSNSASGEASAILGGRRNVASGYLSMVGGGIGNNATGDSSFVGGGSDNDATGDRSSIVGGFSNTSGGFGSTVGGGNSNGAVGDNSTVPGGSSNVALGTNAFAAGFVANAIHDGSFVWSDRSSATAFLSSASNQFSVRSAGGARIYTNSSLTAGVTLAAGGSSWAAVSDSTLKRNIREVDYADILDRVSRLPISQWSYRAQEEDIEHIGPMAQDFHRLFGLGEDDKHINTLDPDGIALASIKALNEKCDNLAAENQQLKDLIADLKRMIEEQAKEKSAQQK